MERIINRVLDSIKKNGYPEKKVALPFKAIFQSCKNQDISMSTLLKDLEDTHDVLHEMRDDRIIFFARGFTSQPKPSDSMGGIPDDLYKAAMDKLGEMDPDEVEKMKQKVMEMSPEEQQEMLKKAQELFGKK